MNEKQVINIDFSKGIHRSLDSYLVGNSGFLYATKNIILKNGDLERAPGYSDHIADTISGKPMLITKQKWTTGVEYVWAISDKRINQRLPATLPNDWTQCGSGDLSASPTEEQRLSTCYAYTVALGDIVILTSLNYNVKKYNGTTVADLGGLTTTKAYTVANFMSHIVLGNTNEATVPSPWRIKWSSVGTPETWTGGTSGQLDLIDTDDHIRKLKVMYNKLFCYREHNIWQIVYVGSPSIFKAVPLISGIGTKSPDSISEIYGVTGKEGSNVFVGNDNVYVFDGTNIMVVGDAIASTFYGPNAVVNLDYSNRIQGIYDRTNRLYYAAFPVSTAYPDTMYALDFNTNTWWGPLEPGVPLRCFGKDVKVGITWSALVGTWAGLSGSWSSLSVPTDVIIVGSAEDGKILRMDPSTYTVAGATIESYIETGDFIPGVLTRWLRFYAELSGSDGATLYASEDGGYTWTNLGTRTGGSRFTPVNWHFNFSSEKIRFRLVFGTNTNKARRLQVWCKRRMF